MATTEAVRQSPAWAMCQRASVLVALTLLSCAVRGATYFVDAAAGKDEATGTAADPAGGDGPFRSLARLQQIRLQPGDRVSLRCGQKFAGPLALQLGGPAGAAGAASAPVELVGHGDCGAGRLPLIDGKRSVQLEQGPGGLGTLRSTAAVTQLFLDGVAVLPARFPRAAYAIFPPATAPEQERIPLSGTLAGKDFRGARAFVRSQEWLIEERAVLDDRGTLDSKLEYPVRPRAGVYLIGKPWMLEAGAEGWAYDASTSLLSVSGAARKPVQVSLDGPLLRVEGSGSFTMVGIALDGAGGDGVSVHLNGTVRLDRVAVARSVVNAISVAGAAEAVVTACQIDGSGRDGIFFAEVKRATVRNCRVTDAGTYMGQRPTLAAINAHRTDAAAIEENEVRNSGYIGIRVSGDAKVRRNLIEDSCRNISDCAAIYTWRRNAADRRPPTEIAGNVIVGVIGDTSIKLGVNDYFAGIYLDEFTRDTAVRNNVIAGAAQGIYVHNAVQNAVTGNVLVGSRARPVLVGVEASRFAGEAADNDVQRNTVVDGKVRWLLQRTAGARPGQAPWTLQLSQPAATAATTATAATRAAASTGACATVSFADGNSVAGSSPLAAVADCRRTP